MEDNFYRFHLTRKKKLLEVEIRNGLNLKSKHRKRKWQENQEKDKIMSFQLFDKKLEKETHRIWRTWKDWL